MLNFEFDQKGKVKRGKKRKNSLPDEINPAHASERILLFLQWITRPIKVKHEGRCEFFNMYFVFWSKLIKLWSWFLNIIFNNIILYKSRQAFNQYFKIYKYMHLRSFVHVNKTCNQRYIFIPLNWLFKFGNYTFTHFMVAGSIMIFFTYPQILL